MTLITLIMPSSVQYGQTTIHEEIVVLNKFITNTRTSE